MKKILIRAHMHPFDNLDAATVLQKDLVGTNAGNMVFLNAIIRTLMTQDVQIDTFNTRRDLSEENIERINQEYSCVVLPFANAFRVTFQDELRDITRFIRRLKIPCVVTGVGISATFANPLKETNKFDDVVKKFVKVALEKSAVIGTRGRETSAYLNRLGFKEGSEHRVIGCPSMFWYGEKLPQITKKELRADSQVSINWKIDLPEEIHAFMRRNIALFSDFQYVPQVTDEIRLMYFATLFPENKYKRIPEGYPADPCHPWYVKDQARAFVNIPSWMEYMRGKDFSFGSRIHGNIIALLSGTPAYVIVSDYRIKEISEYHNIPHIDCYNLKEEDTIFSLYEKADYTKLYEGHKERFQIYKDFLEENGLDHIFREGNGENCPYDRRMAELELQQPLRPFFSLSLQEQAQRLEQAQAAYLPLQEKYNRIKGLEMAMKLNRMNNRLKWLFEKLYGQRKS